MMKPYEAGDALKMEVRDIDFMVPAEAVDALLTSPNGYGFTFIKDGEAGAVIGGATMWKGVAQIFAMVNDKMKGHAISFTESSYKVIEMYAEQFNLHRFQCIINPKIERNVKWVHYLGFHKESTMKGAAPDGGDMDMYVRLFEVGHVTPLREVTDGLT